MFNLFKKQTTVKTELLAGLSTFSSMVYIIIVNPMILSHAGLDFGAIMVATILITAFASAFMALFANEPIAIAPGMGISTFVAYTIVGKQGTSIELALSAVCFAGAILYILNLLKIRQKILESIPPPVVKGLIAGIGLFLIVVGLKHVGAIAISSSGWIAIDQLKNFRLVLSVIGFLLILYLLKKQVKSAFILVILFSWIIALVLGLEKFQGFVGMPPSLAPTFNKLSFSNLFHFDFLSAFYAIFLVTLFDSSAGILLLARMLYPQKDLPNLQKALTPDAVGSIIGPFIGSTSLAIHLESAAGIKVGGKTGLTSLVVAIGFLLCLFFYPIASTIPEFASAPVLFMIGYLMLQELKGLNWKDFTEWLPALATVIIMPISFSIYFGFAIGFILYTALKLLTGAFEKVPLYCWILSILFAVHLIWLY